MISQGLTLMLAGMGTVFAFLVLMVYVIQITGFIICKYEAKHKAASPAPAKAIPAMPKTAPAIPNIQKDLSRIACVIAIANKHYGLQK